jgi:hypothetical protein
MRDECSMIDDDIRGQNPIRVRGKAGDAATKSNPTYILSLLPDTYSTFW